jgi:mannose-6-phosphate isomerase-like protein (cupin superfamily)
MSLLRDMLLQKNANDDAGFNTNIEKATISNNNFRKVLFTGPEMQLVLMSLKPNEDIGEEVHDGDQFFRFESGKGRVTIGKDEIAVGDGDVVIVPTGANHNVTNTSDEEDLKLYALYAPPQHKDGVINKEKPEEE